MDVGIDQWIVTISLWICMRCNNLLHLIINKSNYFKKFTISSFFPVDIFSSFPYIIIPQFNHMSFSYYATLAMCMVSLEKRDYNKIAASILVDLTTFIF